LQHRGIRVNLTEEIAAQAARLIADEGLEYAVAKRKAARAIGGRAELPSNEQLEDAVRQHIDLFHADTQPAELRRLREVALTWMQRLIEFRPHLSGAVWRGTATRWSVVHLDLYCDDPKAAEIFLINAGVAYDSDAINRPGREPLNVLTVSSADRSMLDRVTVHLSLHDLDDQRGALRPDARGRSWRGDVAALLRLLHESPSAGQAGRLAPESPGLRAVQVRAGGLGAAALSPPGGSEQPGAAGSTQETA
jgi:hypothetical protein